MMKKYIHLILLALILTLASCGPIEDETMLGNDVKENKAEEMNDNQEKVIGENDDKEAKSNQITNSDPLSELTVHYIDAGQADATLFQLTDQQEEYTILYDTGDWNKNDVVQYLTKQHISDIDIVIISHPHADHIGQLENIMKNFNVGEVWMSGDESSSVTVKNAVQAVIDSDADYYEPKAGEQFEVGSLVIDVLHPASLKENNLNANSISLLLSYRNISLLFTGDAEKREEKEMLNRFPELKADILHLGHHGSNTSSDPAFIKAVEPKIAIYSAGKNNSYGHPDAEVLSLIDKSGANIYGTDVHGNIIVTSDGNKYTIKTEKDGQVKPGHKADGKNDGNENKKSKNNDNQNNTSEKVASGSCININEATKEELQHIIHIGPVRAEDIILNRPFKSVDDLQKINGMGPSRIADIKNEGKACT